MLQKEISCKPCIPRSSVLAAEQFQRVFPENIRLDVQRAADALCAEIRHRTRVRNQADGKIRRTHSCHRETDAVKGNRAFLHDADFILLDEPTSNLDVLNEGIILKSLSEEKEGKTIVLVSHRQSTMSVADCRYHMDNGRVS